MCSIFYYIKTLLFLTYVCVGFAFVHLSFESTVFFFSFLSLWITTVLTCITNKANRNSKTISIERETDRNRQKEGWLTLTALDILEGFKVLKEPWRQPATLSELQRKTRRVIYTSGQKSTNSVLWAYSKKLLTPRAGDGPLERDLPKHTDGPQNTAPQLRYTIDTGQVCANR